MFDLDLKSRLPISEQLMEKLKQLIVSDLLKPNEQLPSVRQLASQLNINPNTIQKAYRELEQLGYIYSLPGKGSFVAQVSISDNALRLSSIKAQMDTLLTEAIYLGLEKETLEAWLITAYDRKKGGQ